MAELCFLLKKPPEDYIMFRYLFSLSLLLLFTGCETDNSNRIDDGTPPAGNDTDTNNSGGDGDSDTDTDSDTDSDSDGDTATEDECGPWVKAVVRDFSRTHPNMEMGVGADDATTGLIEDHLTDNFKPIFKSATGSGQWGAMLTNADDFDQWYLDVGGINYRYEKTFPLTELDDGTFMYNNDLFFPLEVSDGFGETGLYDEFNTTQRNFHFTTEIHTMFTYKPGQVFSFNGDDDLWTFINGKLVIDLGGLHMADAGTVNLDTLGLTPGEKYQMDIFHAERQSQGSHFKITTSIQCFEEIEIE